MTLIDLLNKYIAKEMTAVEVIRRISSVFDPDAAVDLLALINSITRHELKDMDTVTFNKIWGLGEN